MSEALPPRGRLVHLPSKSIDRLTQPVARFLSIEAAAGVVLVLAAAVGFTMALFIANPAFVPDGNESAKLGILFASLFCAAAGMAMLRWMSGRRERA